MTMFAKWFYGFNPDRYPVITFSQGGSRDSLLRRAQPGDVIVFVGTQGEETADGDKGRVLGAAEIGSKSVKTEDIVDMSLLAETNFVDGVFRWPEAIPMLRAWRFDPKPYANEVFKRGNLPHHAQTQAVELSKADEAAIRALNWVEVDLASTDERERQQRMADAFRPGPTPPGPVVGPGTHTVTITDPDVSWTYAAEFGESGVWKIGRANDVGKRLRELNAHVPTEYLGQEWKVKLQQRWPSPDRAQEMEQRVLAKLTHRRTQGERVECSEKELQDAWVEAIAGRDS